MRARSTTLILCYHGVSDAWEHDLSVRPAALERQLRGLLFRRYRPVTAAEALKGGRKVVHVTFDDAFRNVANALPALERLRVPATIFACAAYAADGRPLQVPRLAEEVRSHPEHVATMTWDELRALAERGVEIGSHTLTHRNLPTLSDAELDRELSESRQQFEAELGRPCRYLAYPWGEHDERIRAATRKAGYEAAFALRGGADGGDPYAVPRIDLYRNDHLLRAMLKTSFVRPLGTRLLQLVQAQKAVVAVLS